MKSSILAAAVLATLAGSACAQSSVTIYGVLDAGVTREWGGATGDVTKLSTGVWSGNRLGFKGTEDLGNGLKANFQLENGFNLDDGTQRQQQRLFGRQAWVGLSGAFGAVNLGRQYSPIFVAMDSIDPFETGLPGATTNLMNAGDVRINNSITYTTPNLSGFQASVLYGLGETPGDSKANRTIGGSVAYANGPVALVVVHDRVNQVGAQPGGATNTRKLTLVGGTFDFGLVKLHAAAEAEKDSVNVDYRDLLLGVTVPAGQSGKFVASVIDKDDRNDLERGGRQYAVGYIYSLSKRTDAYTAYGNIRNDNAGTNFVGDASSGGSAPVAGDKSSALSVGLRHRF